MALMNSPDHDGKALSVVDRRHQFVILGTVILAVVALFAMPILGLPVGVPSRPGAGYMPRAIAVALLAVGLVLLIRGAVGNPGAGRRWSPIAIILLTAMAALALVPNQVYRHLALTLSFFGLFDIDWALRAQGPLSLLFDRSRLASLMSPADYASLLVLELAIAVACAAWSRLAGLGMLLLGMLAGLIGTDVNTGTERLTFGIDELKDGLPASALLYGVAVASAAVVGMTAPDRFLSTASQAVGRNRMADTGASRHIRVRLIASVILLASAYLTTFFASEWLDLATFVLGTGFGVACIFLSWNRWLFLLGLFTTSVLEVFFRRAMLLSRGSFDIFISRPLAATMLAAALGIATAVVLVTLWRARSTAPRA